MNELAITSLDVIKKKCYACKQSKPISEFGNKSTNKDGLQRICKPCQKAARKKYYDANKEKEFENHRRYEIEHRGEINAYRARQRAGDPTYYKRTHEAVKRRSETDLDYLITRRARYRIERAIAVQGAKPDGLILHLLGCPVVEYRQYLETTFNEGMSWAAYRRGEMQIDHRIPCCCFDLSRPDHQRACFHYSNTRMLWTKENIGRKKNQFLGLDEIERYVRSLAS